MSLDQRGIELTAFADRKVDAGSRCHTNSSFPFDYFVDRLH